MRGKVKLLAPKPKASAVKSLMEMGRDPWFIQTTSVMPVGGYAGQRLAHIPASYLEWVYETVVTDQWRGKPLSEYPSSPEGLVVEIGIEAMRQYAIAHDVAGFTRMCWLNDHVVAKRRRL